MATWGALLQFLIILSFPLFSKSLCLEESNELKTDAGDLNLRCIDIERNALLQFREGIIDPLGHLASWVGKNCCGWKGVHCSNQTGHVAKLDLRDKGNCFMKRIQSAAAYYDNSSCLGGKISSSLLDLKYLKYLDLSMNDFQGIPIPDFLGSFERMRYLNLSFASFSGTVPPHLGNLSNLRYLDLLAYSNPYDDIRRSWVSDLNWVSGLTSLKYLNLGGLNLSLETNWLQALNRLPSLSELHLSYCGLQNIPPSPPNLNFTTLLVLDLSNNQFKSLFPQWLFNISYLAELKLSSCYMKPSISKAAWEDLCHLQVLDLSFNEISGDISDLIGDLSRCSNHSIEELYLLHNQFSGQLPESLGFLKNLRYLSLDENWITGPIPESIGKLSNLNALGLAENQLNGTIPESVGTLTQLTILTLYKILGEDVAISDTIPHWLEKLCPQIRRLDLSYNQIGGMLPNSLPFSWDTAVIVDFSVNRLGGQIPLWPNVTHLILANNLFSGSIPTNIGQMMSRLEILDLSGNFLNGSIPLSISDMEYLQRLYLSNNLLCGEIHGKWRNLQEIRAIDLSRNNLSGNIPSSICSMPKLFWLRLSSNSLSGELSSLKNCTSLSALDLGDNEFSGNIPQWIGESLLSLIVLRIRANMFYGNIPENLCHLYNLHILDLAGNNLSGSIPSCLGNLSGLSSWTPYSRYSHLSYWNYIFTPQMVLVVKGLPTMYTLTLILVRSIDLSDNNLRGDIPEEITRLSMLGTLNLSRNQLTGKIPDSIGGLKQLETLDLSCNHLSGPIPLSMTSMTSLSSLNVSYNNLSGQIPSTNQFQTFNDPAIYEGNLDLCGSPLQTPCLTDNKGKVEDRDAKDDNNDEDETLPFYISMGLGFGVGFWAVFGSLVMKRSWRHAYFKFLDRVADCFYIYVRLNMARLPRMVSKE
ncbi:unnamed protein product [Ilex paraguariensis]|uniref:Leucine-rich repeat-containing N-terminal plant-type domain-containing protein n=1 Tax=Ilex paraguariensis TaxID=185542 RepID=A0ABC8S334_9AQUA